MEFLTSLIGDAHRHDAHRENVRRRANRVRIRSLDQILVLVMVMDIHTVDIHKDKGMVAGSKVLEVKMLAYQPQRMKDMMDSKGNDA